MTLHIGLYGNNGHQIQHKLKDHPRARLVAVGAFSEAALSDGQRADGELRRYDDLAGLLADDRVDLVSLCSARRAEQAEHAIACLEAGKHVYAEKPSAFTEADLERILAAAKANDRIFHEMSGSAFNSPYFAMREVVQSGVLGTVVQVTSQKSYPYLDGRPQDEDIDGGLTMQAGIHAYRWIEHVAGVRIATVQAAETTLGNPKPGELRMASVLLMTLENGGVASVANNYLNPKAATNVWGYESLRIFGTHGMVESEAGGTRTRLYVGDEDRGPLDLSSPPMDYFDRIVAEILDGTLFPFTQDDELHPLRIAIRARATAHK